MLFERAQFSIQFGCANTDVRPRREQRFGLARSHATTADDIVRAHDQHKIAALMGIEGGHAIENSLFALREFYRLGVRYMTLRLEDDTFIHFVESTADDSGLPKLAAFQAFQSGIRDRCVEPPMPRGATIVGNYRMLGEH